MQISTFLVAHSDKKDVGWKKLEKLVAILVKKYHVVSKNCGETVFVFWFLNESKIFQ